MKKIFILASLLLPFSLFAQQPPPPPPGNSQTPSQISRQMDGSSEEVPVPVQTDDEIFTFVEVMPEFPGGRDAMNTFIGKNLRYPADALEAKLQGTVFITFIVNKDGSISQIIVLRGVSPSLDKEAIRVVKSMPKWRPGSMNGKTVRTQFNLPVKFSLK
jgi:protein TonB